MSSHRQPTRVAIVGAGNVGATFAYTLLLSGLAPEIVLIDVNRERAEGEAMDLNHSVPFASPATVWAGDYSDCAGAAATIITAGVAQRPGETRLELARRNVAIVRQVVPQVAAANPEGVVVVATNPVDVLTHEAWRSSGLPPNRVIGSGTMLDTARFRYLLSEHFGVDPRSVHAWIVGEHGDSEVPVWSLANIAGMRLAEFAAVQGLPFDSTAMEDIFRQTRDAAYRIIERKGATYYAIGVALLRLLEAITRDQDTVLSVSSRITEYYGVGDVSFSLPTVINRSGVARVLRLRLDEREAEGLQQSAAVLAATIRDVEAA